ncbi:MAG: enoyl-CoA hydratase/isomerase family protein [Symbiobacteriaceae bacterium]|jgi:enoyl-CoA hydratase|nr:enoyl-CoA hydratase/isomerase family protein [Symbiobacteriaceae bacterium]
MSYEQILVFTEGAVGRVQLNRPQALNALNSKLMAELVDALQQFEANPAIRCILLHGDEKAFAAGADIKEMADQGAIDMYAKDFISLWDAVYRIKKPIVAAVSGFALGGGCELAMICDTIIASETAKFGQPEINIGVIPGAGGTQRLTRAVGKATAMDMVLTGRMLTAAEAKDAGLVARVVPPEAYLSEAQKMAAAIAAKSPVALQLAKESVLQAFETSLAGGIHLERRLFYMAFASEDQKEGMKAFMEKRKPEFTGR